VLAHIRGVLHEYAVHLAGGCKQCRTHGRQRKHGKHAPPLFPIPAPPHASAPFGASIRGKSAKKKHPFGCFFAIRLRDYSSSYSSSATSSARMDRETFFFSSLMSMIFASTCWPTSRTSSGLAMR